MIVVIPVDSNDFEEAKITPIKEAKFFVFLDTKEGKIKNWEFKKDYKNDIFDYMVVMDKNENLEDVFELGARALLGRKNMYIDDIVEALMFAELDEIV